MCEPCKKGITFEPEDLVIQRFTEWDFEKKPAAYYESMQAGVVLEVSQEFGTVLVLWMGKVLEVSQEHGTVLVLWGTDKDKEIEREWCWPSDFVARIRNGKYETIRELRDDPSFHHHLKRSTLWLSS